MEISAKQALSNSPIGYAYHKVIYNLNNDPIDYEYIDVNDAFCYMTGFSKSVIGKSILQIAPDIIKDSTDWIKVFGKVATECSHLIQESYSKTIGKWFYMHAYAPEKGYFIVLLTPIAEGTTVIQSDVDMKLKTYRNESLIRIMSNDATSITELLDYALTEAIKLTQSDIGYIYFYNDEKKEFSLNTWSNNVMDACSITEKQTIYQLEKTGFWGEVVRQKKAIINNDFMAPHKMKKGMPEGHTELTRFMSLPVFDRNKIVAVIGLGNKQTDYDGYDVKQIQLFMEDVWMISKRKQIEVELEFERENLWTVLETITDGIIFADHKFNIVTTNNVLLKAFDVEADKINSKNLIQVIATWNSDVSKYLVDRLEEGTIEHVEFNKTTDILKRKWQQLSYNNQEGIVVYHQNKVFYSFLKKVERNEKNTSGYLFVLREITDEYNHTEQIQYMSYHDALTGLYNRRFFEEELIRLDISRSLPLSIIMGDVNGLKLTNDAFGHEQGDKLLKAVAQILKNSCRKGDIIARWGGDEFIILLPNTSASRLKSIFNTIKESCQHNKDNIIDVSVSLGQITKHDESEDVYKLITIAEDIMYKNKLAESKSQRSTIIEMIKNTLFERNHETEEHAERLIEYCMHMAEKLGLSEVEKANLRLFAVLHDIGKIGIADAILLKPNSLTEDEWYEMRKHPVIGYRIAMSSVDLQHIALNILHHHERWDGTGYPDKLKGEEIPVMARILAIADAFDAMTSDRPYRSKMSKEQAIEELKRCAGCQFDEFIVSVFI